MTKWTVAIDRETCGYDGRSIGQGQPMQLITLDGVTRVKRRCAQHRLEGTEVDEGEVAAARQAIVDRQLDQAPMKLSAYRPVVTPRRQTQKTRAAEQAFSSLSSIASRVGVSLPDPKQRAANDVDPDLGF